MIRFASVLCVFLSFLLRSRNTEDGRISCILLNRQILLEFEAH